MANGVRSYLAGLCHGTVLVWLAGYAFYKGGVPLAQLFDPAEGVLPPPLALLPLLGGGLLLQWNANARRTAMAENPSGERPASVS